VLSRWKGSGQVMLIAGRALAGPAPSAISLALPYAARVGCLGTTYSVKTEGLVGLVAVEYRILVPARKSGVILGHKRCQRQRAASRGALPG